MDKLTNIELNSIFINITHECYVCLETINDKEYSILQCCDKSTNQIHNSCLLTLYLNSMNHESNCPLCRHMFDIKDYLDINQLKKLVDKLQHNDKLIYKDKIDIIIPDYNSYMIYILYIVIIIIVISIIYAIIQSNYSVNKNRSNERNYPRSGYGRFLI